jgi:RsiW-degrading membrane proteinase PrsW (M82 family)
VYLSVLSAASQAAVHPIVAAFINPWFIGGAFVAIHAWFRFNTPPTSRSSTTTVRFFTSTVIYTVLLLVLYIVLGTAMKSISAGLLLGQAVAAQLNGVGSPQAAALETISIAKRSDCPEL